MTSALGSAARRGLRRIVDTLQRSLFDDVGEATAPAPPATSASAPPPDHASIHPQANREIVLDGRRLAFRLVRIRRRSIGFVVDASGLTVRAPKWIALREIDAAVREKQGWISARLAEMRERAARHAAARTVWRDGASVEYLGQPLTIVLDAQRGLAADEAVLVAAGEGAPAGASRAEVDANTDTDTHAVVGVPRLLLGLPRDADEARIRDAVQSWLQREARRVFAERAAHFAARLGVRVTRLSLSSAATRWGSANANGAVRLHWRLIQHPLATIDYVVAHELAHLREMNHSPRFWKVVESVVPDYEEARSRLRRQGRLEG